MSVHHTVWSGGAPWTNFLTKGLQGAPRRCAVRGELREEISKPCMQTRSTYATDSHFIEWSVSDDAYMEYGFGGHGTLLMLLAADLACPALFSLHACL